MKRYRLEYPEGKLPNIKIGIDIFVKESDALAAQAADKERIRKLEEALRDSINGRGSDGELCWCDECYDGLGNHSEICLSNRSALGSGGDEKTATKGEVR